MISTASILVTGSSSGLGRQIAETLARQGATVFASLRDMQGKNQHATEQIRLLAEREQLALHPIELDVTDSASVEYAIRTVLAQAGRIDVVINNAAGGITGITEACTMTQIQQLFDVNVLGALRVNQAVLPHMRRQQSGLLIYISSTSSQIVVPFLGVYGATKAALESLALSTHYELFSLGIDTVVLQLGGYATKFGVNLQRASQHAIWSSYQAVGQMAHAFADAMPATMEQCDDPQQVATLIGELIALPAGQRPLKISVGMGSEGLESLNQTLAVLQHQLLDSMGMGVLARREMIHSA